MQHVDNFTESFVLNGFDEDYHDTCEDERSNIVIEYSMEVAPADYRKIIQNTVSLC